MDEKDIKEDTSFEYNQLNSQIMFSEQEDDSKELDKPKYGYDDYKKEKEKPKSTSRWDNERT